ncbi:MAG: Na+/H+ antiporter [Verrucomicrobia bacterium]|nr:Na+/H+ antiporter [Verrucomicrobiota bacterium]
MDSFQTLVVLIFLATLLVGIAQKIGITYPIALVLGGTAIGFIPCLASFSFNPNLILPIVLPPILYYAAFSISFREFKKNWKEIFSLALGLVAATTFLVGLVFKWLFPELPWAIAFAFGAIVSPPDAIATTTILKRFAISPRLLAVLEGESLINDASALILYRLTVVAALSGLFSLPEASLDFCKIVSGGILVGFVLGHLLQNLSRKFLEPVVGVLFSFTIPYVTYILADALGVSGVLAVVVNGLIGSRILAKHHSSLRRVLGYAFWDTFVILMNCFVFVLIGLQLRSFVSVMLPSQMLLYSAYGLLISLALIVIRLLWVYSKSATSYLHALVDQKKCHLCPHILREATLLGWSGMRGIVSLAAALALPYSLQGRDEIIFITFVVLLVTLILPSTTLTYLVHLMKLEHHVDHHGVHQTRKKLSDIAEERIKHLLERGEISDREHHFLADYFTLQRYVFEISSSSLKKMSHLETIRLKVIQSQRHMLLEMWERLEIDDKLFHQMEHELDVQESHIVRAELT